MQMSGGHLLVAGLDGDNTIIFSSPVIRTNHKKEALASFLLFIKDQDSNLSIIFSSPIIRTILGIDFV